MTIDMPDPAELEETPAPQPEGETTEPETEDSATEGEEEEGDGLDDYEFDGASFRAPRTLREKLSRLDNMDADYTKKSQANADRGRALDQREAAIEERSKASDEELDARATLRSVTNALEQAKQYDWNMYQQHRNYGLNGQGPDPIGADEAWAYVQHLKNQKAELEGKIGEAEKARSATADSEWNTRVQETLAYAAKNNIPRERLDTVVKFAAEKGVPEAMVRSYWGPLMLDILNLAQIGQEVVAKRASKPPSPAPAKPMEPIRPKGKAPRPGLNDDLPIEEWRKKFSKQYFG